MARIEKIHRRIPQELRKNIEKLRKERPEDFKDWMSTKCIADLCLVLEEVIFEPNDIKMRRFVRTRIRPVLDKHGLERTRIKCDRENNRYQGRMLNVEIHRPAAGDDDYMKLQLRGVR